MKLGTTIRALATALVLAVSPARAADPPVPIGQDPGGKVIAIVSSGINYTVPSVAAVLARDGEGEMIGWDFVDGDSRPYAKPADPSVYAVVFAAGHKGYRQIHVRVDQKRPETLVAALSFLARTPARDGILLVGPLKRVEWEPFRQAMLKFSDVKLHVLCRDGEPPGTEQLSSDALIYADQLGLPNELPCQHVARTTPPPEW